MRELWKAALLVALVLTGAATPAVAGVQKVVFDEEFGFAL